MIKNHGKRWEPYDDEQLLETYREKLQKAPCVDMAIHWTASELERTRNSVHSRLSTLNSRGEEVPRRGENIAPAREYAFYRGEKLVAMGTYKELGKITGLKEETLRFYASAAHKKRMKMDSPVVIRMDEDEDDPIEPR